MKGAKFKHKPVGALANIIDDFINYKRMQGFKYIIEESTLYRFSVSSQNYQFDGLEIPSPLIIEWYKRRPNEKITTFKTRCSNISIFLVYAKDHGYKIDIPEIPQMHIVDYVPYIFTENELTAFFNACDSIQPYGGSRRHEIIPILFRLLYSCGLRSSEAAMLKISDVDLKNGILTIREPKNRKDRYVPMSQLMTAYLRRFHILAHDIDETGEHYFFQGKYNECLSRHCIYKWFRLCLENAGIPHRGKGFGPREHDLRHTFCVNSLKAMCEQGMDIYCCLPILSTYVGHKSIYATQKYLRLTPEIFPDVLKQITIYAEGIIPNIWEVADHEAH